MYLPLSRKFPVKSYTFASIPPKRDDKATVLLTVQPFTKELKSTVKRQTSTIQIIPYLIFSVNEKYLNKILVKPLDKQPKLV